MANIKINEHMSKMLDSKLVDISPGDTTKANDDSRTPPTINATKNDHFTELQEQFEIEE